MGSKLDEVKKMMMAQYARAPVNPASQSIATDSADAKWVWWWFRYFRENLNYKAYCDARRTEDRSRCAELEANFARVAELYADWDDIHALKPMSRDGREWKSWLYEHRHLFFVTAPTVQQVTPPIADVVAGNILVQIPAGLPKKEVVRLFAAFVERHYVPSFGAPDQPPPKYLLYAPGGRIDRNTFDAVRKAYFVEFASEVRYKNTTYRKLTNAETALKIMDIEGKEELGFKTWDKDADLVNRYREGTLSMTEMESYKKMVKRHKDDYAGYVANTIRGIFPKKEI